MSVQVKVMLINGTCDPFLATSHDDYNETSFIIIIFGKLTTANIFLQQDEV